MGRRAASRQVIAAGATFPTVRELTSAGTPSLTARNHPEIGHHGACAVRVTWQQHANTDHRWRGLHRLEPVSRGALSQGFEVSIIDNVATGKASNLDGLDVDLIEASILDTEALDKSLVGVESVIHLRRSPAFLEASPTRWPVTPRTPPARSPFWRERVLLEWST